jgi:hypothetical protein
VENWDTCSKANLFQCGFAPAHAVKTMHVAVCEGLVTSPYVMTESM